MISIGSFAAVARYDFVTSGIANGRGWDAGFDAPTLAGALPHGSNWRGWMRQRGVLQPVPHLDRATQETLRQLRGEGVQAMPFLRAVHYSWPHGRRLPAAMHRLPRDSRDAFELGQGLGARYGTAIAGWEIDNEPDVGFVPENPENYAAFLKAMYLGLHAGAERTLGWRPPASVHRSPPTGHRSPRAALVVMAPLALPPGPYFEALVENGLLSYTDGFNYHYYGYAQDFSGMYRMFEEAVLATSNQTLASSDQRLAARSHTPPGGPPYLEGKLVGATSTKSLETSSQPLALRKSLPIFLSEYGYPLLSGKAGETTEGRVRQWRFFRDALKQAHELQIEGPMAFYLPPYLEYGIKEFGLTVAAAPRQGTSIKETSNRGTGTATKAEGHASQGDDTLTRSATGEPATRSQQLAPATFRAGGVEFRPEDFGTTEVEPWMRDIGRKIGDAEASPAMAWLMNQPGIAKSRPWVVRAEQPSPVVIDFIAGEGMSQAKAYSGHFLTSPAHSGWAGRGELRVYNFGRSAIAGRLMVEGAAEGIMEMPLVLRVGEMRKLPLSFSHTSGVGVGQQWRAVFVPTKAGPQARFSSWVFPNLNALSARSVEGFTFASEQAKENTRILDSRRKADEEEQLHAQGRWRVTKGVQVIETDDLWRFTVAGFPDEPMRPAVAELPLPDGFRFERDQFFLMEVRLMRRTVQQVSPADEPRAHPEDSRLDREPLWPHVRTATGNLFMMAMEFPVQTHWQVFRQRAGNFTPAFYGRMELPWRFSDHQPVALVFHFRPRLLPAVYEIRKARVAELTQPSR